MTTEPAYALVCVDILNAEVDRLFHYAVPEAMRPAIKAGMRVLVPFGRGNKLKIGYVIEFSAETALSERQIKTIDSLCDAYPILTDEMIKLALWMQSKYYTTLAACLRCVQPAGLPAPGAKRRGSSSAKAAAKPEAAVLTSAPPLTEEQRRAVAVIQEKARVGDGTPVLLHGVTGSGKTEVYLRIIADALAEGRQAIVLVPEIALTPQTVGIFTGRFGDAVGVTHSRMTARERFNQWKKAADGLISVMIGPRSAVFTPFQRLGVMIIDEEHEHTYQSEVTPKYATRDVVRKRAELTGATVIFGSATPSLETYYRATREPSAPDAYTLVKLTERVNKMFPTVSIIDMRQELAEGNISVFGRALQDGLNAALAEGRQALLFLNRRGHSSFVGCRRCGHVLRCDNCNVNFTYHAVGETLRCHYCGQTAPNPTLCPACGSKFIRYFGIGTQKIEEETNKYFPGIKTLRMDMDTTKGKHGHAAILDAFRKGEAQVLIGTQMIAKGLDFPNVTLVGIMAADISLFTGDFRAGEYTFQLLTQVAGRAGRAEKPGTVFIQTYNPAHYGIIYAKENDYEAFYRHEIAVREAMQYPPFTHVFCVLFTGPDEKALIKALHKLLAIMRYCNKKGRFEMLGPTPAFVSKIKKQFRWKLTVKGEQEELLKRFVIYCMQKLKEQDPLPGIVTHLTLDPVMID